MRRKSTRRSQKTDEFELLCQLGEQMAAKHGEVRYVDKIFKNCGRWTRQAAWERLDGDEWLEIEWPEFENHST